MREFMEIQTNVSGRELERWSRAAWQRWCCPPPSQWQHQYRGLRSDRAPSAGRSHIDFDGGGSSTDTRSLGCHCGTPFSTAHRHRETLRLISGYRGALRGIFSVKQPERKNVRQANTGVRSLQP
jgi:hypothetical protein